MESNYVLKLIILIFVFILTLLFFHRSILIYKRSLLIQGIIWKLITKSSTPGYMISISLF